MTNSDTALARHVTNYVRVAVVTGGTSGIGRALVRRLAHMGFQIIGNARHRAALGDLETELGDAGGVRRFVGVTGDAADPGTLSAIGEVTDLHFGGAVDVFVVNAGQGLPGTILESNDGRWEQLLQLNVLGALRQMRWAGHRMRSKAVADREPRARDIIVIGSIAGRVVSTSNPVYGATKFAITAAAEALRRELASHHVRVTLLQPGFVRTEFQERAGYDMQAFALLEQSQGPFLQPEDVAATIGFVISQPLHVHLSEIVIRPTRQSIP